MKQVGGYLTVLFLVMMGCTASAQSVANCEQICGKWISAEKNLVVQVYRENGGYVARIVWFNNPDNTKAIETYLDEKNPDKHLRNRKLVGLNVLNKLNYNSKTNSWEDGSIYDSTSGKTWNACAYVADDGCLKVTGYWHFKFIGKTLTFNKVNTATEMAKL